VIKSFKTFEAAQIFNRVSVRKFESIEHVALRRLRNLHSAIDLRDLQRISGNRLEKLKGNREGQFSIRINDQYRICYNWIDGDAYNVEIVDYQGGMDDKKNPPYTPR
jgi:toxin HigB-1